MRTFMLLLIMTLTLAASNVFADEKPDSLSKAWPKLAGTWVTPYKKSAAPNGNRQERFFLTFRMLGTDRLFEQELETRTPEGTTTNHGVIHSAVMVVAAIRKKDHKQYLVVRPKSESPKFETEIQYELVKGKLKLQGFLGSAKLTGEWLRLKDVR